MKISKTHLYLAIVVFLFWLFFLSGCLPVVAIQEMIYRPSPNDPYKLWQAYVTDSGLLFLCASVDNGREGMERVERVYNLELRLEETLDSSLADTIQIVQIDSHPSLKTTKGYLSDLCQFNDKRLDKKPKETGWIEIFMDRGDEGFVEVLYSDLDAGQIPIRPIEPRVVIFRVLNTDPQKYLLMGQLREGGSEWIVLLILGSDHIDAIW